MGIEQYTILKIGEKKELTKYDLEEYLKMLDQPITSTTAAKVLQLIQELYCYHAERCVCGPDTNFAMALVRARAIKRLTALVTAKDSTSAIVRSAVLLLGAIKDTLRMMDVVPDYGSTEVSEQLVQLSVYGNDRAKKHAQESLALWIVASPTSRRDLKYNELLYYAPDLLRYPTVVITPITPSSSSSSAASAQAEQQEEKKRPPRTAVTLEKKEGLLRTALVILQNKIPIPRLDELLKSASVFCAEAKKHKEPEAWTRIPFLVADLKVAAKLFVPEKEEEEDAPAEDEEEEDLLDDPKPTSSSSSALAPSAEDSKLTRSEIMRRYLLLKDMLVSGTQQTVKQNINLSTAEWNNAQVTNSYSDFRFMTMAASNTHWVIATMCYRSNLYYLDVYYTQNPASGWTAKLGVTNSYNNSYPLTVGKMICAGGYFLIPFTYHYDPSSGRYGFYIAYANDNSPSSWNITAVYNTSYYSRVYSMSLINNYYVICGDWDPNNNANWYTRGAIAYSRTPTSGYSGQPSYPSSNGNYYFGSCLQTIYDGNNYVTLCIQRETNSGYNLHRYFTIDANGASHPANINGYYYPAFIDNQAPESFQPSFVFANGYYAISAYDRVLFTKDYKRPFYSVPLPFSPKAGTVRSLNFFLSNFIITYVGSDNHFYVAYSSTPDGQWKTKKLYTSDLTGCDAVEHGSVVILGYKQNSVCPQVFCQGATDPKDLLNILFQQATEQ